MNNVSPDTGRYSVTALQLKKYATTITILGGVALIVEVDSLGHAVQLNVGSRLNVNDTLHICRS